MEFLAKLEMTLFNDIISKQEVKFMGGLALTVGAR